ncbi:MAG TPA: hypothetical protein DF296_12695 [Candidatus Margulisbacteria bacterium]|nr:MAG: hypothetical protein A2X43_01320 [Candidatus Margulisbacteria bacterium GWD2_39_127]HAR63254.1 hypothetical protein [Candidatus Margulisiibacteriota bacterium]HCT86041.1 hypothetical protein [Candidatus Margulisiibacteriota bacterium]
MKKKIIDFTQKKYSKVIVPIFASNSSSVFSRIDDSIKLLIAAFPSVLKVFPEVEGAALKNVDLSTGIKQAALKTVLGYLTKRDYSGNLEDYIYVIHFLHDIGVKSIVEFPFTQKHQSTTSPFSASSFGLELDYLVLELVPEIQDSPELLAMIPKRPITYENDLSSDFRIHREARRVILKKAASKFYQEIVVDPTSQRAQTFKFYVDKYDKKLMRNAEFSVVQSKVLDNYENVNPDFRTWPEKYRSPDSPEVKKLITLHSDDILAHKYGQFCIHEQQLFIKQLYELLGMEREVNIAFGIDPAASADVWSLQDTVFNLKYELGADNGQNWHVPAYNVSTDAYIDFVKERLEYLSEYAHVIFFDHLCGYSTQYIYERGNAEDKGRWEVEKWDAWKMRDNAKYLLKMALDLGLKVGGETLGDYARQQAVECAIHELNCEGYNIPEMFVAPHKNYGDNYGNNMNLSQNIELFLTTHDLPTIVQIICGTRGNEAIDEFRSPKTKIANFMSQQFGIITTPNQTPLSPGHLSQELGIAMLEVFMSYPVEAVTIPLQDIFALMFPEEVGTNLYFNMNHAGTPTGLDNEMKNFSRILPPIQNLEPFKDVLKDIFSRTVKPFDFPERLEECGGFFTWIACITPGRKMIFQNPGTKKWEIFKHTEKGRPVLEMVVSNVAAEDRVGMVKLPSDKQIDYKGQVDFAKIYKLVDISRNDRDNNIYIKSGEELLCEMYISLKGNTDHHFVIYEMPN